MENLKGMFAEIYQDSENVSTARNPKVVQYYTQIIAVYTCESN